MEEVTNEEVSPVLFLIFNRPDLTEQVFQRIRSAKPRKLFVSADGARSDRTGEEELCTASRKVTEEIDWPCEVKRFYRDTNHGCKAAVSEGISWFFENVEEGIILEDDCLPSMSFFSYATQLLATYRNSDRVGIISGCNPHTETSPQNASYFYSRYPMIWGWASWRRTWKDYDPHLSDWTGKTRDSKIDFECPFVASHLHKLCKAASKGNLNTWDMQLVFLCLSKDLLTVIPSSNLITNIGFDERATHSRSYAKGSEFPIGSEIRFPLQSPTDYRVNRSFDESLERKSWRIPSSFAGLIRKKTISLIRTNGGKLLRLAGLR